MSQLLLRFSVIGVTACIVPIILNKVISHFHVWVFYPFLFPVLPLGEVETGAILVFEVEDCGDLFVRSYDFGDVYSSGIMHPLFIFFYRFLGIAHFFVSHPRVVFTQET